VVSDEALDQIRYIFRDGNVPEFQSVPKGNVSIQFPAVPFRQAPLSFCRRRVDPSRNLDLEGVNTWLVAVSSCSLGPHFKGP
jgi:hypothetical protein